MGRLCHFDSVMEKYSIQDDEAKLKYTVKKLWARVLKTYILIGSIRELFRTIKKYKVVYHILAELGIYMQKPGFNAPNT